VSAEIILVRHGSTVGNDHGLLHGRTDIPLAESGRSQARRVADQLRRGGGLDAVYTSPLIRARTTAEEIATAAGVNPRIDPDLREFDFGDLEGIPFEELQSRYPDAYFSMLDPAGYDYPFPNGESRKSIHERVSVSLDRISQANQSGRIVVVAHLIVIATAMAHLTTGNPDDAISFLVENCSISRLRLNGSDQAEILQLNDVSHLKGL
jgi:broad specificity phosphatase PhoE